MLVGATLTTRAIKPSKMELDTIIVPRRGYIELVGQGTLDSPIPNSLITAFSASDYYCVVAHDVCVLYDTQTLDQLGKVRLAQAGCDSVCCRD